MTLFERMANVADKARQSGMLVSIPNQLDIIEAGGIPFVLRFAPQLLNKIRSAKSARQDNPFLPPESALYVEPVGDHHALILNKFNVLPVHGLLITNHFVDQTDQFSLNDFRALSQLLAEEDALVFYNGGKIAGASQRHRHFQIVPKDMGAGSLPVQKAIDQCHHREQGQVFPFKHRLYWLPDYTPETLQDAWLKLEYSWQPFNLLLTRQWMLVVPRRSENVAGISVNSLGFAGALLAKNEQEYAQIQALGPLALLSQVCDAD